jgi:L-2-hydroxyglutarate oxidase LhgO
MGGPAAAKLATVSERFDLIVVGGGILGLATAAEWHARRPGDSIAVLERESRVAGHQTSHNSGVIHAGIYYKPGSLKARLCTEGRERLYAFCAEHEIPFEKTGKLVIATRQDELRRLDDIEARARANGVPGLRRLGAVEIEEIEPHARGVAALFSPETGIVDFGRVADVLAGELRQAGAAVQTGIEVQRISSGGATGAIVAHRSGELTARQVICCAGAWSDRLAVASGAPADPCVVPFRGAYLKLRADRRELVRTLIYPVPDPSLPFLGVHLTKHISGDVLLGPTALLVGARDAYSLRKVHARDLWSTLSWPGTWRMARRWWRTGLSEMHMASSRRAFVRACARYVPALTVDDLDPEPGPAGVRAQAVGRDGRLVDDFVLSEAGGALHVRNAPSPAATSALALAREIVDRAVATGSMPSRTRTEASREAPTASEQPGHGQS